MTIYSAEEFLRLRASDEPAEYRRAALEDAPLEVWMDVVEHFPDARVWVAHNKTIPVEVLQRLVSDPDPRVRHAVVMKRKATAQILNELANDSDESIRMRVAMHKNVSRETLKHLQHDSWDRVREAVAARLGRD